MQKIIQTEVHGLFPSVIGLKYTVYMICTTNLNTLKARLPYSETICVFNPILRRFFCYFH